MHTSSPDYAPAHSGSRADDTRICVWVGACPASRDGIPRSGLRAGPKEGKQRCVPCTLPGSTPTHLRSLVSSRDIAMVREGHAVCAATSTGAHPHKVLTFLSSLLPLPLLFPRARHPLRAGPHPKGLRVEFPRPVPHRTARLRDHTYAERWAGCVRGWDGKVLCVRLRGIPDDAMPSRSPSSSVPFIAPGCSCSTRPARVAALRWIPPGRDCELLLRASRVLEPLRTPHPASASLCSYRQSVD
ncbi:hypothetical protein B0H13DRAFT_2316189 [Mycena leptocephala]|nr:hypothetical protein B0H13DRAFT_2316189 [Mycena leptocephala]